MKSEPQIFRYNPLKNWILLLVCAVFVALGVFIVEENPKVGWAAIVFFGLGVIVSLIQFYPKSNYLKLTNEGFEIKSLFRSSFTKWSDVKDFSLGETFGNKMIFFDYTEEHKNYKGAKKFAKFLSKKEGAIPSSYTIKTYELLILLNEYKRKSE